MYTCRGVHLFVGRDICLELLHKVHQSQLFNVFVYSKYSLCYVFEAMHLCFVLFHLSLYALKCICWLVKIRRERKEYQRIIERKKYNENEVAKFRAC